ncbi:hypothetical protein [Bacillus atrophaeus]|uniref:hypothetical protein n=1 Tax=Bacillus atrophaeus TaxID=1452 RepID=UPI0022821341|nr:hypothetical protein [Bacillus atrophaeus]MCY8513541.1 hypothetical protein [Bacillus atrophaeus]MCY8992645.1 hypothetical protein [Bacillus atrophaeus]MCY9159965.1 hypothetical protein [Bacillus atrophaeus]
MNWLEFFSSILNSWSVAIVIVVAILKKPISSLINRIGNLTNLKYKDLDLSFGDKVSEIKSELEFDKVIEQTEKKDEVGQEKQLFIDEVMRLAKVSPQEAIYKMWLELEKELRYMLVRVNAPNIGAAEEIVMFLKQENYISTRTGNIIFSLLNLRNAVARDYPEAKDIKYSDAIEYFKIIEELIAQFKEISSEYYDYTPSV